MLPSRSWAPATTGWSVVPKFDGERPPCPSHFLAWAAGYDDPDFTGRSIAVHEEWLTSLPCPVLRLDSDSDVVDLVASILRWEP